MEQVMNKPELKVFISEYRGKKIYRYEDVGGGFGFDDHYCRFNTAWSVMFYIDEMLSP